MLQPTQLEGDGHSIVGASAAVEHGHLTGKVQVMLWVVVIVEIVCLACLASIAISFLA